MWSRPASNLTLSQADLACAAMRPAAWADPVDVASAFFDETHACVLLSGADGWTYVLRQPDVVVEADAVEALAGPPTALLPDGPPFQGGVVGLAAYEFSAQLEPTAPQYTMSGFSGCTAMKPLSPVPG